MIKYECPNCHAQKESDQPAPVMCEACNVEMTKVEEAAAPATEATDEAAA